MKRFKNILCVVPPAEAGRATLERALSLAENNQARLTLVDVIPLVTGSRAIPGAGATATEVQAAMSAGHLQALRSFIEPYRQRLEIRLGVLTGTPFLEIIRAVLRNGHDLLIKSAENPGFVERLFGSDDMHLLRKCPCPVWLTQPEEKANYGCILAAVDFDPDDAASVQEDLTRKILELSASLALSDFAALHVVHVWDAPGEMIVRTRSNTPDAAGAAYVEGERLRHQEGLDRLRREMRDRIGAEAFEYLAPHFHLRQGAAARVIPETAKRLQVDLVVMGTVARTGIAGLLIGNTAEAILEQLRCSVLAVKPAGFVTPVKPVDEVLSLP